MTWLDRAIGWIAPEAGLRRARARAALALVRAYEGASTGRRTANWRTSGASANAEVSAALPRLRNRSRDLVRNNPYARRAIAALVGNAVGTGITLGLQAAPVERIWTAWIREADYFGDHDLFGLEALIARAMFEGGDCLVVRHRTTMAEAGRSGVPLRIKVFEGDFLDTNKHGPLANGNVALAGVEMNRDGRRVALWIYTSHPGETSVWDPRMTSVRVPAEDVIYAFEKERPGQILGAPRLAASIMRLRDLDEYQEALLVKKKIEACFAAFVRSDADDRPLGVVSTETDADGNTRRVERLSPGQIIYGKPGEEITFGAPASGPEQGFAADELRAIAVGAGVTYEQLTGDLSRVNYSSMRGGRAEFKILVEQFRWLTFIPQVLEQIYGWFEEAAFIAGKVRTTGYPHVWTPPRWEYVNPLEDIKADKEELAARLASHSGKVRERGESPERLLEEIESDQVMLAKKGITPDYGSGSVSAPAEPSADDKVAEAEAEVEAAKVARDQAVLGALAENGGALTQLAGAVRELAAREAGPASITINTPPVHVNLPEGAVRVEPTVEVRGGDLRVDVPAPEVTIIERGPARSEQIVERDGKGEISRTVTKHHYVEDGPPKKEG